MIDNDLRGKGSSYRPVRIRFLKCIFNSFNILYTAVIKRCSEADNKNLIFSDIILIQRIILGCIACISSKVIRICIFTFYQFLLGVCQCVPGFFRFLTLFIRLIRSLLYVDCINSALPPHPQPSDPRFLYFLPRRFLLLFPHFHRFFRNILTEPGCQPAKQLHYDRLRPVTRDLWVLPHSVFQ